MMYLSIPFRSYMERGEVMVDLCSCLGSVSSSLKVHILFFSHKENPGSLVLCLHP